VGVLLARVVLGERLAPRTWVALPMALAGVTLMLYDATLGLPLPMDRADWLGLTAGLAFAITTVETRRLQAVSVTAKTLASWVGVYARGDARARSRRHAFPDASAAAWAGTVALGCSGFLAATLAVQFGRDAPAGAAHDGDLLLEIVVGAVSSAWLAAEYTETREWLGGMLIVGAGLAAAKADEVR